MTYLQQHTWRCDHVEVNDGAQCVNRLTRDTALQLAEGFTLGWSANGLGAHTCPTHNGMKF